MKKSLSILLLAMSAVFVCEAHFKPRPCTQERGLEAWFSVGRGKYAEAQMAKLTGKRAVMIIAERNFRDEELLEPKAELEKEGVKVDIASTAAKQARGMLGATVAPDKLVSDINVADYDAIIFVGGSGAGQYWNDPAAHSLAKEAAGSGKILGAICIAPVTLANAGVLMGKKATCWPSERQALKDMAANYTGKRVEVDGNIITADGPGSAAEFGKALVKKLGE